MKIDLRRRTLHRLVNLVADTLAQGSPQCRALQISSDPSCFLAFVLARRYEKPNVGSRRSLMTQVSRLVSGPALRNVRAILVNARTLMRPCRVPDFMPVQAQLSISDGQLSVAVQAIAVYQDGAGAVHWLNRVVLPVYFSEVHVFSVLVPVA